VKTFDNTEGFQPLQVHKSEGKYTHQFLITTRHSSDREVRQLFTIDFISIEDLEVCGVLIPIAILEEKKRMV